MKVRRSNTRAAARAVSRRKKVVPRKLPAPRTYVDRVCDLIRQGMS